MSWLDRQAAAVNGEIPRQLPSLHSPCRVLAVIAWEFGTHQLPIM